MLNNIKNILRKDEHGDLPESEVNKEITTLLFTLLLTFIIGVYFEVVQENSLEKGILPIGMFIYVFLRYKQRGAWHE